MAAYTGWKLPEDERARLLARFPPRYPDVIADHVTLQFGVSPGAMPPWETQGEIVGAADDGTGVQALVVAIGGTTSRPDGSVFHIIWSIDRAAGRRPVDSNGVVRAGWEGLAQHIPVRLLPMLFR
jgi:hypothetical protein